MADSAALKDLRTLDETRHGYRCFTIKADALYDLVKGYSHSPSSIVPHCDAGSRHSNDLGIYGYV